MKTRYLLYTTRDVAHLLYVSEDTVRQLNASGYLGFPKGFKVRGQWRFFAEQIDAWIDELPSIEVEPDAAAVVVVHKGLTHDKGREKEARLFEAAGEMYEMLRKLASKNKFCSNKEITALLARIDNK